MPYIAIDATTAKAAPVTTLGAPLTSTGETLTTLLAELKRMVIRTDADDPRYTSWINQAYRHIASIVTLNEMMGSLAISTDANQPFYKLPNVVAWIKQIPLNDPTLYPINGGRNMELTDLNGYRGLPDSIYVMNNYGPYKYFRFGRVLVLWPTPILVQSVVVDFRIRPSDLVNGTDSPILPPEWHEGILLRARRNAFRATQQFDKGAIAQNDFLEAIRPLLNTDAEEIGGKEAAFYPARELRASYRRSIHPRYN